MPGTTHHADLSKRSHAQKLKQPAISAIAAMTYASSDLTLPLSFQSWREPIVYQVRHPRQL
jgi:hypothetical protein